MKETILVGGKIEFDFDASIARTTSGPVGAIYILANYLFCFLKNIMKQQEKDVLGYIKNMLSQAYMSDDLSLISISFPKEITDRFLLKKKYDILLTPHNIATFYCEELCVNSLISCTITVNIDDSELRCDTETRLRHLLSRSKRQLKKIRFGYNRKTEKYDVQIVPWNSEEKTIRISAPDIDEIFALIADLIRKRK